MNALVGERMCIINKKPQTTRHRIIGILSEDNYQVVFSDTPGFIDDPSYKMQSAMHGYALSSFEDADIMLLIIDSEQNEPIDDLILKKLKKLETPKYLILNKVDLVNQETLSKLKTDWNEICAFDKTFEISALHKQGTDELLEQVISNLPEGPAYYPKDQFTDRPERFFVSEIIREKILEQYHQEIPYSSEVIIESFKDIETKSGKMIRIEANIFVARKTQKSIIIGKGGSSIKNLGIAARKSIEAFLDSRVHLELFVKVKDNWRNDERTLKHFGYQ